MTPEQIKDLRKSCAAAHEEYVRVVAEAMLQMYKAVTSKPPSDRLLERIMDAVEEECR